MATEWNNAELEAIAEAHWFGTLSHGGEWVEVEDRELFSTCFHRPYFEGTNWRDDTLMGHLASAYEAGYDGVTYSPYGIEGDEEND